MPAQSIIIEPVAPKTQFARDKQRYYREQAKAFARRMPVMRLRLGLVVERGELVCESHNVKFRHPAALRYFRKRLDQFLREMDGTIVVEDPPEDRK